MSFRLQNVCLGNVTGIEVGMMFMRLYRLNRCRLQLFCHSMCSSCLRQGSNNFSSIAIAKQPSKTHWGHKYRPCGLTWRTEEYQRACLVPTLFWALGDIFFFCSCRIPSVWTRENGGIRNTPSLRRKRRYLIFLKVCSFRSKDKLSLRMCKTDGTWVMLELVSLPWHHSTCFLQYVEYVLEA